MATFQSKVTDKDYVPAVKTYEGIGELVVGVSSAERVIAVALCMLNHPLINQYFLDNNVRFQDRLTKTQIFPRNGMALPDGHVYIAPEVQEVSVDNQTEDHR